MLFNVDKCKVMHFSFNNQSNHYAMKEHEIELMVNEERDLDVLIHSSLKVGNQCMKQLNWQIVY